MSKQKRYMALDFGFGHGVAMAGGFDGKILELDPMHRFAVENTAMLGTRYWDFPAMIINAKRGLAAYAAKHGAGLDGVAVDSWGMDFGLLDQYGQLLANPVHHLDRRTLGIPEKLHSLSPARDRFQVNGCRMWRHSTLSQLHAMVLADSPLLDRASTLLLMADLVSYFLSGTPVQEYTLATTTCLYDAASRDWSREMLASSGIPPGLAPEIVAPGTVIGTLREEVAEECGLEQAPIIAAVSHGMAAAVAAVPAAGEDWLFIHSDDIDQVGVELSGPVITDEAFAAGFSNLGGVDGSFRFLKTLFGFHPLRKCMEAWSREDGKEVDFDAAMALADTAQPLTRVLAMDDPRLYDAVDMPTALNEALIASAQPPAESREELARLCLDSLVLSHRHAIAQLTALAGRTFQAIHVVGPGSAVRPLCQAMADAAGIPVKAGPIEARAVGNLMMQAIALGDIASLDEAREIVGNSFGVASFAPRDGGGMWNEGYMRYLKKT